MGSDTKIESRPCESCGGPMRGSSQDGVWLPNLDEQIAEVYNPRHPEVDSIVCHAGCIPDGYEIA